MSDGAEVIGVEIQLDEHGHLDPGDEAECQLRFWAADVLPAPIGPGTLLWLLEGSTTVAEGEVLTDERYGSA